ncbi:GNAT family N-acetyltransferase [Mucilaginibacter sp. BJC16-A38]|uniref:GNAT family N-acetyltransferase n=1 Tax=Mucilaginibacter phenanthrenivorans TaxID=1234842 RepID=UPI0021573D61|nr:GNAT family N-acetyltransferase [Mucilaginibacter phenanthrenivorans]MCR8561749.1 GNAT family N-acetyltransferase [Mucilaginibacter phenanthrenivorans]
MFFIESERLRMIPLTRELLKLLHTNRNDMEQALGLNPSNPQISEFYKKEIDDAMINFWLPKTLANPKAYKWYTNWEIILKSTNTVVGGMGFSGDPNEEGEAETGYMINEQHQNKGYASEALQLLSGWAFMDKNVKAIIVHTYADNLPSRRILAKCGFKEVSTDAEGLMKFRLIKD